MNQSVALLACAVVTVFGLAGCVARTRPPGDVQVCYQVQPQKGGALKYNRMPSTQPDLEHCAAALEALRLRFLGLGGSQRELMGAYQGNYLFLQSDGIFTSSSLEAHRYLILVRTGDGRLVIPTAMRQ